MLNIACLVASTIVSRALPCCSSLHACRSMPVRPRHSRSITRSQVKESLLSNANASERRISLIRSVDFLPVTRSSAVRTRARSAVNSTPPMPSGKRARPTRSPDGSPSSSIPAVFITARLAPIRRCSSSATNSNNRPVLAASLVAYCRSRALVCAPAVVAAVDMNWRF